MEFTQGPGKRPPVGTKVSMENLVDHVFARRHEEQVELLREFAPLVLARLDPVERQECEDAIRAVPTGQAKLDEPSHPPAGGPQKETVLEELLGQPVGAQLHVLQLLASRVLGSVRGAPREALLRELFQERGEAEAGQPPPSLH